MNETSTQDPVIDDEAESIRGSHRECRGSRCGGHRGHHHRRYHHHDLSELSGSRRLAHRVFHGMGAVVFVIMWATVAALGVAATVAAWRWVFDVLA